MIKYCTALRLGTADTEAILRRFTRHNVQHPTYTALLELGKARRTIFLYVGECRRVGERCQLSRQVSYTRGPDTVGFLPHRGKESRGHVVHLDARSSSNALTS